MISLRSNFSLKNEKYNSIYNKILIGKTTFKITKHMHLNKIVTFIVFLTITSNVISQTKLPSFFCDNMVLQQNEEVAICGCRAFSAGSLRGFRRAHSPK